MLRHHASNLSRGDLGLVILKKAAMILVLFIMISTSRVASAQIIWAGVKVGGQLNSAKIDAVSFRDTVRTFPGIGFNAGAVVSFKVKDRYFLVTEYTYSLKRKINKQTERFDPDLKDKINYHYLEVPILFTRQFKVRLGAEGEFKWYLGVGPNIAYLLGGRGVIKSGLLQESGIESLRYKLKFDTHQDYIHLDNVHYAGVNRFQFGINVGTGFLFEPVNNQKIIIDLRYTFDQTLFGKKNADYLAPSGYYDNLKFRNRTLRISVMYLLQYNLDKKERHKGKSTFKSR